MSKTDQVSFISLHSTEAGSDKIYQVAINQIGDLFSVDFAYGRRGAPMKSGSKTPSPVNLDHAKKIADKLIAEKVAKGYRPIGSVGEVRVETPEDTGIRGQPLVDLNLDNLSEMIKSPHHIAQEKHDGHRRIIIYDRDGNIFGANKRGVKVPVSSDIQKAIIALLPKGTILDGELMGAKFIAFDILTHYGKDLRNIGFISRFEYLKNIAHDATTNFIDYDITQVFSVSEVASGPNSKLSMIKKVRQENGEGVVFKRIDGKWRDDRSEDQTRYKFWHSLSAIVGDKTDGKNSVQLLLIDNGEYLDVGRVTVPEGRPIPVPGSVIEVKYRIAYKDGALYMPVLVRPRDDVSADECVESQRIFKEQAGVDKNDFEQMIVPDHLFEP